MKYGTEQKDLEAEGSRDIAQFIFAPLEKKWQLIFHTNKKQAIHFSPSLISVNSGNTKTCEFVRENVNMSCIHLQELVTNSPSVTQTQKTEVQKRRSKEILKAQTVAATLMQPCLARNTLLYHLLYKYTAFF